MPIITLCASNATEKQNAPTVSSNKRCHSCVNSLRKPGFLEPTAYKKSSTILDRPVPMGNQLPTQQPKPKKR